MKQTLFNIINTLNANTIQYVLHDDIATQAIKF